jgi:hypothetical protein
MRLTGDELGIKTDVLRFVPIGTPVEEAKQTMERNGFACRNGGEEVGAERWVGGEKCADGLVCSRRLRYESWFESLFLSDDIQVYLKLENGQVRQVRVRLIPRCF